jgi:hypothetical protein
MDEMLLMALSNALALTTKIKFEISASPGWTET